MARELIDTLLAGGLLIFAPPAAVAQDRVACDSAATNVRGGSHGNAYNNALAVLMTCSVTGPRVLAEQWSRPPQDSLAIRLLGDASINLRDRRLLAATKTAALDVSRPTPVRLTAIRVLVAYFDPSIAIDFRSPAQPVPTGSAYVMLGEWSHPIGRDGAEALTASIRSDVLAVLHQVQAAGGDVSVARVAEYLAKRLEKR